MKYTNAPEFWENGDGTKKLSQKKKILYSLQSNMKFLMPFNPRNVLFAQKQED